MLLSRLAYDPVELLAPNVADRDPMKTPCIYRTYLKVKPGLTRYLTNILDSNYEFLKSHVRQLIMIDNCSAASLLALDDIAGRWLVELFSVNTAVQLDLITKTYFNQLRCCRRSGRENSDKIQTQK
jgi:hypothetical protein